MVVLIIVGLLFIKVSVPSSNLLLNTVSTRLIKAEWPQFNPEKQYSQEEKQIALAMNVIRSIRNIKAEMEVAPSKKVNLIFIPKDEATKIALEARNTYIVSDLK
ncbi:hypothetical protein EOM09_06195 [bacterium]|nr:hypothetical protein [bacterium]